MLYRAEKKVGLREYRRVEVQVQQSEIVEGMRAHPNAPQILKDWLDKEVLHSTALV